jgi:hypothetical protein
MRLSEAITIYLAAGAAFGTHNFLRQQSATSRVHSWLKAARVMILWPLAAANMFRPNGRHTAGRRKEIVSERADEQLASIIGQASRKLLASLYRVVELSKSSTGGESKKLEQAARAAREIVEKYVELTLLAASADPEALPSEREMELCRVAGRKGEDLLLAGRCIHRRNIARLILHQARARTELLHALAEIRELTGTSAHVKAARDLSVETLRFYACAFDLLSLMEDESAARGVARLLDAECARLRQLEALNQKYNQTAEEELCATQTSYPVFKHPTQTRALTQG